MRRLRTGARDAGTTMTELVVTMFILSLVVVATMTLTIGFERTTAENVKRQDQIDAGRVAVERMTRNLRVAVKPSQLSASCAGCTADAFVSGNRFAVQFYANLDNANGAVGPSRVTYTVGTVNGVAGVLQEKLQVPDSAVPSTSGWSYCNAEAPTATAACKARLKVRRLATGVMTTGAPLFSYFDENGAAMTPASSGLSAENLQRVLAIELTVEVGSPGAIRPDSTTYVQRVLLSNSYALLRPDPGATP